MSDKKGPGQPTKYKPEYCEQLIEHMAKGYGYDSFAGVASVHRRTMYDWEDAHEEWRDAKEIAFSKCLLHWEKLGVENVLNETHEEENQDEGTYKKTSKSLNSAIYTLHMVNRFKWRQKQPDEVETVINNNNSNVQNIEKLPDEELDRRLTELSQKLFGNNES